MVGRVFRRVWDTLSEPRFITGLAVTLYAVTLVLGVFLLVASGFRDRNYVIPGVLLTVSSLVTLPSAWVGWHWGVAPELEKIFIPSVLAGLVTASFLDFRSYAAIGIPSYMITLALLGIAILVGVARWVWLVGERERLWQLELEALLEDV